ncbi:hypothetical protein ACIQB4_28060 [Streptomyces griseoluteus]|uniref:hypothetical protein n=1 Tax=Streptomyces griseoluteus TaxID=29306 RepID=UPI0038191F84
MTHTTDGAAGFLTALRPPDPEPDSGTAAQPAPAAGLWSVATALHDELPPDVRDGWARRLYALLQEQYGHDSVTGPPVNRGLSVVHDWQGRTVLPLVAEILSGGQSLPFSALAGLHTAAAAGRPDAPDAWRTALHPVLLHLHAAAYDRTSAYAEGHRGALEYALSQGRSPAEADAYGHEYAELSTTANALAFAEAHALALSDALARAYAADDDTAYAHTCPASQVRVVVRAWDRVSPDERAGDDPLARMSDGLLSALARTSPPRNR